MITDQKKRKLKYKISIKKLLIIEDDAAEIFLLEQFLKEEESNFSLIKIEDGLNAINYINKLISMNIDEKPNLILLDINLPKHNGYEVLKEIKNNKMTQDIPVFIWSSSVDPEEKERSLKSGAKMFIQKPWDIINYQILAKTLIHEINCYQKTPVNIGALEYITSIF